MSNQSPAPDNADSQGHESDLFVRHGMTGISFDDLRIKINEAKTTVDQLSPLMVLITSQTRWHQWCTVFEHTAGGDPVEEMQGAFEAAEDACRTLAGVQACLTDLDDAVALLTPAGERNTDDITALVDGWDQY